MTAPEKDNKTGVASLHPGYRRRMPEGHTIRRYADLHRQMLRGRRVAVSSPQGRFGRGAARLGQKRGHLGQTPPGVRSANATM